MSNIFVIADDLSGAAEIGGIAYQYGFSVRILLQADMKTKCSEDVIIVDSNSRHLSEKKANQKVASILQKMYQPNYGFIYKKTDSLLRGNVIPEIQAFFSSTSFHSALLIHANPSKNHSVRKGNFYIENIPINKTIFRSDPEYPRKWKNVRKLSHDHKSVIVSGCKISETRFGSIYIPDINSLNDIDYHSINTKYKNVLLAGGADFFKSLLKNKLNCSFKHHDSTLSNKTGRKCFIMGSNSKNCQKTLSLLSKNKYSIFHLQKSSIRSDKQFQNWINLVLEHLREQKNIAITTPQEFIKRKVDRIKITKMMVQSAILIKEKLNGSDLIFVEGGETASNLLREMNWMKPIVTNMFSAGVVMLKNEEHSMNIIIKPGSYPWPPEITK